MRRGRWARVVSLSRKVGSPWAISKNKRSREGCALKLSDRLPRLQTGRNRCRPCALQRQCAGRIVGTLLARVRCSPAEKLAGRRSCACWAAANTRCSREVVLSRVPATSQRGIALAFCRRNETDESGGVVIANQATTLFQRNAASARRAAFVSNPIQDSGSAKSDCRTPRPEGPDAAFGLAASSNDLGQRVRCADHRPVPALIAWKSVASWDALLSPKQAAIRKLAHSLAKPKPTPNRGQANTSSPHVHREGTRRFSQRAYCCGECPSPLGFAKL